MTTETLIEEKRRSRRSTARDEFLIEFRKLNRKTVRIGYGCDLSSLGVRFTAPEQQGIGDILLMRMYFRPEFPGRKKIKLLTQVVRQYRPRGSRYYRIGCRIRRAGALAAETIRQFQFWHETRSEEGKH